MYRQRQFGLRHVLHDKGQIPFNGIDDQNAGSRLSCTIAGRTYFLGFDVYSRLHPLACNLHKSKFAERQYGMLGTVIEHVGFQCIVQLGLVLGVFHIDKIDDNQPPNVAQSQLTGNFFCCPQVDGQ